MNKPSSHWLTELVRTIQECHSETDQSFMSFFEDLMIQNNIYGDSRYDDFKLVQALKEFKENENDILSEALNSEMSFNEA